MAQAIRRKNIAAVQQRRKDMKARRLLKAGVNALIGITMLVAFFVAPHFAGELLKPVSNDVQSAISAGHTP